MLPKYGAFRPCEEFEGQWFLRLLERPRARQFPTPDNSGPLIRCAQFCCHPRSDWGRNHFTGNAVL